MIRFLIFDLDDTLYNERQFVYSGYEQVANYLCNKYNLNSQEVYENMLDILIENGRNNLFNKICYKFRLNQDIGELVDVYRKTKPVINLYDDAIKLLDDTKGKYGLGIITDGESRVQWNKIEALGIERYFDKIIVTDDIGKDYWKPSEKPYKEIVEYFGGIPKDYIFIGDNPNKDFISAKKLGMHTIRIIRDVGDYMETFLGEEYEANYTIFSLEEVKYVIEILNEKRQ